MHTGLPHLDLDEETVTGLAGQLQSLTGVALLKPLTALLLPATTAAAAASSSACMAPQLLQNSASVFSSWRCPSLVAARSNQMSHPLTAVAGLKCHGTGEMELTRTAVVLRFHACTYASCMCSRVITHTCQAPGRETDSSKILGTRPLYALQERPRQGGPGMRRTGCMRCARCWPCCWICLRCARMR